MFEALIIQKSLAPVRYWLCASPDYLAKHGEPATVEELVSTGQAAVKKGTAKRALSLPVGLTSAGLPVGLQLVGPTGGDELVLAAALRLEAELGALAPVPATTRTVERMR